MIPSERASQEEQNGTNFSFIAPSSEELWVRTDTNCVYLRCANSLPPVERQVQQHQDSQQQQRTRLREVGGHQTLTGGGIHAKYRTKDHVNI